MSHFLSFTTGKPIALVVGGFLDGEILHLYDSDFDPSHPPKDLMSCFQIPITDKGKISQVPGLSPEQLYISGPNGSGKSYYTSNYLKIFHSMFPKKPIWLFSSVNEDPLLDSIPGVGRIDLTRDLVDDPIFPDQLPDSIVVFDDIDSIPDKDIATAVNSLKNSLLTTSRHSNIYVICTSHLATDYNKTRLNLNESSFVTLFPGSGASNQVTRILKEYCGLLKPQIDCIFSLKSRWVTIHKRYPMYIMYDRGIFLL